MTSIAPIRFDGLQANRDKRACQALRIAFVHTPMATLPVPERELFWRNFDRRYHAAHPGLRHMRRALWELPHWMTWLAGVLVEEGYSTLDVLEFYTSECAIEGVDRGLVEASLRRCPADVYLFSPMTPNLPFAYEIAGIAKEMYPAAKTVFGGVIATPLRERVASHPSVDYVVHGRGEYALPALLDAIRGATDIGEVGNLCLQRDNGEIYLSKRTYPWMPVEQLPFPLVELFDGDLGQDIRYLRIVYSLGCPYKCGFCTIQTIGRKASYFPVERVIAEIRAYRAHYGQHHNIYFGDETFTVNKSRTYALCEALEREGDVGYDCQTRLNLLDDDNLLAAIRRSGCRWVEIGLESFDQETQDLFKQRVRLGSALDALRRVRDAGLPTCSFLVNGFPNQSLDDMRRSIDFAAELIESGLLQASYLFGLVPYPGSDLYERPEAYGITIHHHDYKLYHEDMPPVFSSRHATPDQTYEVFLDGLRILGQAMDSPPVFGVMAQGEAAQSYGSFWQESHV